MKKIFTTFAMLLVVVILAQSPEKMSYQTVIRNASNTLVINQTVGVKISLLQGSATGSAVYAETHAVTTNANGLASLQIGGGTVVSGTFSSIDWANGPYFIKTETDPSGGTNYTLTGTSQLLSVPYALYARTSGSSTPGPQGANGKNTLVNTTTEPAGSNCVNGGVKLEFGIDSNSNGVLENSEIDNALTKYVCNGNNYIGSGANNTSHGQYTWSTGTQFTVPEGITSLIIELQGVMGGAGATATYINGVYSYAANGGAGGAALNVKLLLINLKKDDVLSINNSVAGTNSTANTSCSYCGTGCNVVCSAGNGSSGETTYLSLNGNSIASISGGTGGIGGKVNLALYGGLGTHQGEIGSTGVLSLNINFAVVLNQSEVTTSKSPRLVINY